MSLDRIINQKVNELTTLVRHLFEHQKRMEERIMAIFDDLAVQTAKNTDVIESAIVVINGLADQLTAALASATPIPAVQAVIDGMKAEDDKLAASVAVGTAAETPAAVVAAAPTQ